MEDRKTNRTDELAEFLPKLEARLQQRLKIAMAEVGADSLQLQNPMPAAAELVHTKLHEAIAAKNLKSLNKILREENVDVNKCHPNFELGFPLNHAIELGDKRIIRSLLKAGAKPNIADFLAVCVEENNLPLAKLLIEYGADLNGQPTSEKDEDFETNLIRATRLQHYAFVKLLLEAGADPNRQDGNGESALFVARMNEDKRLCNLLEHYVSDEERARVDERFSDAYAEQLKQDIEIYEAIQAGETEKVVALLTSTSRPLDDLLKPDRGSPLEEALEAYFEALNETCPEINTTDVDAWRRNYKPDYSNPKVVARRETVDALLALNAPVEVIGFQAPLAYLGQLGNWPEDNELGMELIEHANDVNAPITCESCTALMIVVTAGRFGYSTVFIKALLERGADPNAHNCYGETVLQKARECEKWEGPNPCVPLLIAAGAKE